MGTPCPETVSQLVEKIKKGRSLPAAAELGRSPELEASALRALDVLASPKLAALLHADDPLLWGSSRGEIQNTVNCISRWAGMVKAEFHVTEDKTVVMCYGKGAPTVEEYERNPVIFPDPAGGAGKEVKMFSQKRWLGVLWRSDLNCLPDLKSRLGGATAVMTELLSLVGRGKMRSRSFGLIGV